MNRSSSKGESYDVVMSYRYADGGEDTRERRLFGPTAVPCFFVDDAFTCVPEPPKQPSILDRVRGRIGLIGACHCGKTSTLFLRFGEHAVAWKSGRRETLLRHLASPGGRISDRDHFEWGRLRYFDSVFHDSCSDSFWESFIEEAREQHSRQDGPEESPVFAWTHANREGFLLNRLLSYPQSELLKFGEGHHLLRHRPNTEYGLAPAALDEPDVLWSFKRQERTADALASIWSYQLEGLDTIVRKIGSRGEAWKPDPRPAERSEAHGSSP